MKIDEKGSKRSAGMKLGMKLGVQLLEKREKPGYLRFH